MPISTINNTWMWGIVGFGRTGRSMLEYLSSLYHGDGSCRIVVFDDNIPANIDDAKSAKYLWINSIRSGRLVFAKLSDIHLYDNIRCLITSPGIAPNLYISEVHKDTIVISDLDFFYIIANPDTILGITGTNGKSTTTYLTYHLLKHCYQKQNNNTNNIYLGGNIGIPVADLLANANDHGQIYVLELSSFQLETSKYISFNAAACINIMPDHLDRHLNMANYSEAKERIFRPTIPKTIDDTNTKINAKNKLEAFLLDNNIHRDVLQRSSEHRSPISIISLDYQETLDIYRKMITESGLDINHIIPFSTRKALDRGIYFTGNILHIRNCLQQDMLSVELPHNRSLIGIHNQENIAAAIALAISQGCAIPDIIEAIKSFMGLPHRLEHVGQYNNVDFINDSKATNCHSAYQALSAVKEPIYWIAGGKMKKGDDFESLAPLFHKVEHAFLIGEAAEHISAVLARHNVTYSNCGDLEKATDMIAKQVESKAIGKGTILLSPACSSLDQWNNFEQRGDFFRSRVRSIVEDIGH